jgi:D-amino-acid dehydrogenase
VVGGGVVGMNVALALQERGFVVTVADEARATPPASWGNAGCIACEPSEPMASVATLWSLPKTLFFRGGPVALPPSAIASWLPFALRLIAASTPRRFRLGITALNSLLCNALPAWRRRLSSIGASNLLIEAGHYSIWECADSSARGRASAIRKRGSDATRELDDEELGQLRRLLKVPISGSLKSTSTAHIAAPAELLSTLHKAFISAGGRFDARRMMLATAAQLADLVVVAAGVDSGALLATLGHAVPVIAERGYHIQQADPVWPTELPPLYFEDRSIVVTRFRSALRATSFVEFTTRDAPPDPRKWARLHRHARELGLPFDDRATQWVGARPTLPDYLPAIGRSRKQDNVYYAFGHQHYGLTLAALTGELTAALVCEQEVGIDLKPFDIDRFEWSR